MDTLMEDPVVLITDGYPPPPPSDPLMDTLMEDPVVLITDGYPPPSVRPADGHADGGPGGADN